MRLLVVSNRLPFNIVEKEGKLEFQGSPGGLVSGLSAYLDSLKGPSSSKRYIWVGWPGISVEGKRRKELKEIAFNEYNAFPVFISEKAMDKFYYGFCNKTLWPLFHYFPSYTIYDEDYWLQYKRVQQIFCEQVLEMIEPEDVVWIHDFHLMLLPKLLRKKMPKVPIGFFLHIPFPTFEVFRLMPRRWRNEILQGMLGADLIGFHTHDYTQYFLRCVLSTLGYEHDIDKIVTEDRLVKVGTFPMGIDFDKFYNATKTKKVQQKKKNLKKAVGDLQVILSIDRLDYTKGILNRLKGYEIFLEENPDWHGKVVLIAVVVPSRIGVEHYQRMKRQVDELVGKINGRFARLDWSPILYQYRAVSFSDLIALYNTANIGLVTPLRDGMNLIAKEYVATRTESEGVLILSEMAGASKELGEAIIINPNDSEEIAGAIKTALEMRKEEQERRIRSMQTRLRRYDVNRWATEFMQSLSSAKADQKQFEVRLLGGHKERLLSDFKKANRRIIFLDYDGTLMPFSSDPKSVKPDDDLLEILRSISKSSEIVVISGRDKETLNDWLGELDIGLVAEHGAWIKEKGQDWRLIKPLVNTWKPQVLPILEMYADRVPGSFVEEKEFSIVWHYRKADRDLASIRVKELIDYLVSFTANMELQILQGNKVIEIRSAGVNKGTAGLHWLSKEMFDFICSIGDDWTDEDLFRVLPKTAYSIKVGITQSQARYNLYNYLEVRELLKELEV